VKVEWFNEFCRAGLLDKVFRFN